jgi:hypothetical protein
MAPCGALTNPYDEIWLICRSRMEQFSEIMTAALYQKSNRFVQASEGKAAFYEMD